MGHKHTMADHIIDRPGDHVKRINAHVTKDPWCDKDAHFGSSIYISLVRSSQYILKTEYLL